MPILTRRAIEDNPEVAAYCNWLREGLAGIARLNPLMAAEPEFRAMHAQCLATVLLNDLVMVIFQAHVKPPAETETGLKMISDAGQAALQAIGDWIEQNVEKDSIASPFEPQPEARPS